MIGHEVGGTATMEQAPLGRDAARHSWVALALVCAAQFVTVLDFQSVSIALPAIQRGLGLAPGTLQWVVTINALTFGGFLLLASRAADRIGRRRTFMAGLALLAASALCCGLARSPAVLIGARAVQGLAAAIVTPAALAILSATFPEGPERNRALGIWGAVGPLGGIVGIGVGGVLAGGLGWPWVFFLEAPLAVLALALSPLVLPGDRGRADAVRLDVAGAALATTALVLLVYGLTEAQRAGFGSPRTVGVLAAALALLVAFRAIEGWVRDPLVPFAVFRRRTLTGANLVTILHAAATNTPIFFFALYMQQVAHRSPLATGLAFLPVDVAVIAGAALGTALTNHIGHRWTMAGGMASLVIALLLLTRMAVGGAYIATLLPGLVLYGLGVGIVAVAVNIAGTAGIGDAEHGLAWGLINTSARIGTALGLAALVALASARTGMLDGGAQPSAAAQVAGYRWAFVGGAVAAAMGMLVALGVVPRQESGAECV